jgi:hypothetical protein
MSAAITIDLYPYCQCYEDHGPGRDIENAEDLIVVVVVVVVLGPRPGVGASRPPWPLPDMAQKTNTQTNKRTNTQANKETTNSNNTNKNAGKNKHKYNGGRK